MANTKTYNVRIDSQIRQEADTLFRSMGMSLSAAVNLFLTQSVIQHRLPLTDIIANVPNANLLEALEETDRIGKGLKRQHFDNAHDLIKDILSEEDINV